VGYDRWAIAVYEGLRVVCLEVLSLVQDGEEQFVRYDRLKKP